MDDLMIKVENVSKRYKLGQIGGTTLREELQRKVAKLLKKEDPTIEDAPKSKKVQQIEGRRDFYGFAGCQF